MKNRMRILKIITMATVFITAVLIFLNIGELHVMVSLNILSLSALFFVLSYEAVNRQTIPHAKRLLIIGLSLIFLAIVVLIFGQIQ